jgi:hypothetical protein
MPDFDMKLVRLIVDQFGPKNERKNTLVENWSQDFFKDANFPGLRPWPDVEL